jgi:hypothetical protein
MTRVVPKDVRATAMPGMFGHHPPDDRGVRPFRPGAHRRSTASVTARIDERDQLPLVGHLKRVQTRGNRMPTPRRRAPGWPPVPDAPPTRAARAISTTAATRPPLVGSRRAWTPPRRASAASIAATSRCSGALSVVTTVPKSMPSRTLMIATPCSPTFPETMMSSPGRARSGPTSTPVRDDADARGVDEQAGPRCPVRRPWCHRSRCDTPARPAALPSTGRSAPAARAPGPLLG